MRDMTITLDVLHVPELVWGLRKEMATILREEAEMETDPRVARRLACIADSFEAGQSRKPETT